MATGTGGLMSCCLAVICYALLLAQLAICMLTVTIHYFRSYSFFSSRLDGVIGLSHLAHVFQRGKEGGGYLHWFFAIVQYVGLLIVNKW
jgi:hypothetical protein